MRRIVLLLLIGCQKPEPPKTPPPVAPAPPPPPPVVKAQPSPTPFPLPPPSDPKARLHAPPEKNLDEKLPDPALDWLVIGRGPLKRAAILGAFDPAWRRNHDAVRLYGWHGERVVLLESDPEESYDRVAASMTLLVATGDDDLRVAGASTLAAFRDDAVARLKQAGAADVQVPVTPEDGTAAARKLQQLFVAAGTEVQIKLLAPGVQLFDGKKLLDVLVSLGLPPQQPGGAVELAGFEVKTKSPPGWFDARALAENRLKPNNLVFQLYVPNAQDPVTAFDLMVKASQYAQKRLGGTTEVVVENFGAPKKSDLKSARKRVIEVDDALKKAGFLPGSPTTLRLFHLP